MGESEDGGKTAAQRAAMGEEQTSGFTLWCSWGGLEQHHDLGSSSPNRSDRMDTRAIWPNSCDPAGGILFCTLRFVYHSGNLYLRARQTGTYLSTGSGSLRWLCPGRVRRFLHLWWIARPRRAGGDSGGGALRGYRSQAIPCGGRVPRSGCGPLSASEVRGE